MKENHRISLIVNGQQLNAEEGSSILEAVMQSGNPVIDNIGCAGQGVCGSCRVLVKRKDEKTVTSMLACETKVEEGLQASFLEHLPLNNRTHVYKTDDWEGNTWNIVKRINEVFPEAKHCRHCGGCDNACPKHLEVQKGVNMASVGDLNAATIFDECIMCNLCTIACPEMITPNHLGSYIRRLTTAMTLRPSDLLQRLNQIESGEITINVDAEIN